ncbi:MAG: hypothetical protein AABX40_07525 [Candidatus Hydrothermarchaeota archaeon]
MRRREGKREEREDLYNLAKLMFDPAGKEPYYLGSGAIRNLEELKVSLDSFTPEMAEWVASWVEYLGDRKTAEDIRRAKGEFKRIIEKRYTVLRKYYTF